jgi:hypothetical protein
MGRWRGGLGAEGKGEGEQSEEEFRGVAHKGIRREDEAGWHEQSFMRWWGQQGV